MFWFFGGWIIFSLKLFYISGLLYYRPTPTRPFSTIIITIQQYVQAISYYILKTSRPIVQQESYHLGMGIMFDVVWVDQKSLYKSVIYQL